MKIKFTIIIICSLVLVSCSSDELTKSKAEALAKECEANSDKKLVRASKLKYGEINLYATDYAKNPDFLEYYQKLEKLGVVKLSAIERKKDALGEKDHFEVSITSEGEKYRVGKEQNFLGTLSGQFKICEYKFIEIKEIQEISERNEAKVLIVLKRFNETPFFQESNERDNPKEIVETALFRKTTDWWKLCDRS